MEGAKHKDEEVKGGADVSSKVEGDAGLEGRSQEKDEKKGDGDKNEKDEEEEEDEEEGEGEAVTVDLSDPRVLELFRRMGVSIPAEADSASTTAPAPPKRVLPQLDLKSVAEAILAGKFKNIIVMTGAGISVAAGIPDFRTPGTGLYDNLQKYDLPHPTAVFELSYFRNNPKPFFTLAKELYPGNFKPTCVHYFIRLLAEKGLLLRNYTQNVDTLERVAGVPGEKLMEAHGCFAAAHCVDCQAEYSQEWVHNYIFSDQIPHCSSCKGLVKPDIVFFGENLPAKFFQLLSEDFPKCDLLLVIGTSLQVRPFSTLVGKVGPDVPRVLINREEVNSSSEILVSLLMGGTTFNFGPNGTRDIKHLGDCQEGIKDFARLLGWEEELERLYKAAASPAKDSASISGDKPGST